jgi:hypothetical protein
MGETGHQDGVKVEKEATTAGDRWEQLPAEAPDKTGISEGLLFLEEHS